MHAHYWNIIFYLYKYRTIQEIVTQDESKQAFISQGMVKHMLHKASFTVWNQQIL